MALCLSARVDMPPLLDNKNLRAEAASILEGRGYDDLRNVIGGMEAWEAAGLPAEGEHDA